MGSWPTPYRESPSVPASGLISRCLSAVTASAQPSTVFRIVRIESAKLERPPVKWVVVGVLRRAAASQSAERIHREHSLAEPAAVTVPIPPASRATSTSLGLPSAFVTPARGWHQLGTSGFATNTPRHQLPPVPRRHSCPVPPTGPVRGWSGQPVVRGRPYSTPTTTRPPSGPSNEPVAQVVLGHLGVRP